MPASRSVWESPRSAEAWGTAVRDCCIVCFPKELEEAASTKPPATEAVKTALAAAPERQGRSREMARRPLQDATRGDRAQSQQGPGTERREASLHPEDVRGGPCADDRERPGRGDLTAACESLHRPSQVRGEEPTALALSLHPQQAPKPVGPLWEQPPSPLPLHTSLQPAALSTSHLGS